jgi:exonuclease-1
VGIDGYSWIHKAMHSGDLTIYTQNSVKSIYKYFSKKIKHFLKINIKIVLVFDGAEMPLKKHTNQKRRIQREQSLAQLKEYINVGNIEMARKYLPLAMSVSPQMVKRLIEKLNEKFKNIQIIIAPYEADS